MRYYRDLTVWQRSMDLVVECHRISARFPREERFELTRQLHRAAISVAANIAEGNGRSHTKEYLNHLSMSTGLLTSLKRSLRKRLVPSP